MATILLIIYTMNMYTKTELKVAAIWLLENIEKIASMKEAIIIMDTHNSKIQCVTMALSFRLELTKFRKSIQSWMSLKIGGSIAEF